MFLAFMDQLHQTLTLMKLPTRLLLVLYINQKSYQPQATESVNSATKFNMFGESGHKHQSPKKFKSFFEKNSLTKLQKYRYHASQSA